MTPLHTVCRGCKPQPVPGEEPEPLSSSFCYSGLSYSQCQRNCDYCCGAGGCLKDPTPGKAQMLCPHKPQAPLVKGAEHSWNPQAHCLHVGRTAPDPICFTMAGAQGSWVSFSLVLVPLPTVPVFSPITCRVTDLISVTSMWTTGESETSHSGVLKVVLL